MWGISYPVSQAPNIVKYLLHLMIQKHFLWHKKLYYDISASGMFHHSCRLLQPREENMRRRSVCLARLLSYTLLFSSWLAGLVIYLFFPIYSIFVCITYRRRRRSLRRKRERKGSREI